MSMRKTGEVPVFSGRRPIRIDLEVSDFGESKPRGTPSRWPAKTAAKRELAQNARVQARIRSIEAGIARGPKTIAIEAET
jgi:hypothetical protein